MKFLMLAVLPLVASADCTLKGGLDKLETSCTIPDSTQITSECCSTIQGIIDKSMAEEQPTEADGAADQQILQQNCMAFATYSMQHLQEANIDAAHGKVLEEAQILINALPDGLTCTEKIKGAGKSACGLHFKVGKLENTCEISEDTTITSECCDVLQGNIDATMKYLPDDPPQDVLDQEMSTTMSACQSVFSWGMQHQPVLPADASPEEKAKIVIDEFPAGNSCTQTITGGDTLSMFAKNAIISKIALAAGAHKHISDEASAMPLVAAGIVGFLAGGLVVTGVLSRYSKKQHDSQYSLLAAEVA